MSTETNAKTRRLVQLAVTTALATTALTGCTGQVAPTHAASASKAESMLAKGKYGKAVANAEAAVLAAPRDAATRTLLANVYLESGRFQSAATAYGEAVELGDSAPRTIISYALALTASGDQATAQQQLRAHQDGIDAADYGLAIALAGDPQEGVHVLGNALRAGQNTPKVRQNLAYAFALTGDWSNARLLASQDLPGDQVNDRLAQWALLAQSQVPTARVASLLGVSPAADPGRPDMLALSAHPAMEQLAAESAKQADPAPAAVPQTSFAMASELPAVENGPVADSGEAALADASLETANGQRFVSKEVVQSVPKATPAHMTRAADAFAAPAPAPSKSAAKAPSPSIAHGDYNVQLGSYFSMSDAQNAWKEFQRKYPELADAERVITKARVNGKIYYRVAAAGFARNSAASMCSMVKGKGGGCIAYASANPLPGALDVMRDEVRVAAR